MQRKKLDKIIQSSLHFSFHMLGMNDLAMRERLGRRKGRKSNPIKGKQGLIVVGHAIEQPYFVHDTSS